MGGTSKIGVPSIYVIDTKLYSDSVIDWGGSSMSLDSYVAYLNRMVRCVEGYKPVQLKPSDNLDTIMGVVQDLDDLSFMDELLKSGSDDMVFFKSYDFLDASLFLNPLDRVLKSASSPELRDEILKNLGDLARKDFVDSGSRVNLGDFGGTYEVVESEYTEEIVNSGIMSFLSTPSEDDPDFEDEDDEELDDNDGFDMEYDEFEDMDSELEDDEYSYSPDDEEESDNDGFDMFSDDDEDEDEEDFNDSEDDEEYWDMGDEDEEEEEDEESESEDDWSSWGMEEDDEEDEESEDGWDMGDDEDLDEEEEEWLMEDDEDEDEDWSGEDDDLEDEDEWGMDGDEEDDEWDMGDDEEDEDDGFIMESDEDEDEDDWSSEEDEDEEEWDMDGDEDDEEDWSGEDDDEDDEWGIKEDDEDEEDYDPFEIDDDIPELGEGGISSDPDFSISQEKKHRNYPDTAQSNERSSPFSREADLNGDNDLLSSRSSGTAFNGSLKASSPVEQTSEDKLARAILGFSDQILKFPKKSVETSRKVLDKSKSIINSMKDVDPDPEPEED